MGIDIRNPGSDSSDSGTDPNPGTSSGSSGGNWWVPQGTVQGTTSGHTVGGATPVTPAVGSAQWNQILQNIQNAIASNGQASTVGFSGTSKLNDMFAIDFLGFNFGSVNQHGTPNVDIMEDAVIAVGSTKRMRSGWEPFDIALMDDEESDVMKIIMRQMDEQMAHGDMFDMNIRYYDQMGNETSSMHLSDCEIIAVETDPLNMATASPHTPLKVVATIQPRVIRFS